MVTVGKLTEEDLDYWIPLVNGEYGLSDKNHISKEWFMRTKDYYEFISDDKHYIVLYRSWNMYGENEMTVVSLYIKPEFRTIGMIRQAQREILELAKIKNVKYIYQGSHLNKKYDNLLKAIGYKPQIYRLEV